VVAALLLLFEKTTEIQAAEISCPGGTIEPGSLNKVVVERFGLPQPTKPICSYVLLKGEIVAGDFEAFRSMLQQTEPYVHTIALLSPGGDVADSLKIGHLIRERMLETEAPFRVGDNNRLYGINGQTLCTGDQCYCASACFFIWSAGIKRHGDAIIVHRPRDVSGSFGRKQAARASAEYNALLDKVSNYLLQMDVPAPIVAYMNSISWNNALYIPEEQITSHLDGYVPSVHEWLIADCGATSKQEDDDWEQLTAKRGFYKMALSPSEQAYLDLLNHKGDKIRECNSQKILRERIRLTNESPL
jgi:hypothetical protein